MTNPATKPTTTTEETPAKQAPKTGERIPIAIKELHVSTGNPHGATLPVPGRDGGLSHVAHRVIAGVMDGVKTEIDWRPWMRMYVVSVSRNNEAPRVFTMPETWACAVPLDPASLR